MRIDTLNVRNFKGFATREFSFHPQFNLVVGVNGTGKTSLLDALSIAAGSWFLGLRGYDTRHLRTTEVFLAGREQRTAGNGASRQVTVTWEAQYPCSIEATGQVMGQNLTWTRKLNTPDGRTTYVDARTIKDLAEQTDRLVRSGSDVVLPLISYYGTGRLWDVPREQALVRNEQEVAGKETLSRLVGYHNSVDPRLSVSELVKWIARQSWITYQQGGQEPSTYIVVREAIIRNLEGATNIRFDANFGEVIVEMENQSRQPFNNLSDGQRCMLAMVGDIAQKAATLNPHLGARAPQETPGVVLIDELDLHLHPRWQRHVIEDLRTTFPQIQFIATTHSPFLIQSLRPGELINLDPEELGEYADKSIEDIAENVMGVELPQKSERYQRMMDAAETYFRMLREPQPQAEAIEMAEQRLNELAAPFSDDPAFQALLKLERETQRGGNATG